MILIINLDIKDFFNSVSDIILKRSLIREFTEFASMKESILDYIIQLCTHDIEKIKENKTVIPQGSPVSPILSNVVCIGMDYSLVQLSREYGLKYTRYVDDITFSSDTFIDFKSFFRKLNLILECNNFIVNSKKTRIQKRREKQVVTGLVVNKKVNVDRKYIKNVRMLLHIYEKFDLSDPNFEFSKLISCKYNYNSFKYQKFYQVLRGKIEFIGVVKGKDSELYKKLLSRYNKRKEALSRQVISN